MVKKILISTSSFGKDSPEPLQLLQKNGIQYVLNPHGRKVEREELLALAKDCDGVIAGTEKYDAAALAALPNLKSISRCGAGMDGVDLEAAKKAGVRVMATPDAPTQAVAELAVGLMLDACRKISRMDRAMRKGEWKKEMGGLMEGKSVGIIGLGRIGRRVAELLSPFGVKIIAVEPNPDREWMRKNQASLVTMDELLKQADIISLHVPLTQENRNLLDADRLSKMKKGAILINTSRGGLVDERALKEALKSGPLGAAALDVYVKEPYDGDLKELENIILTPHIGAYAKEARIRMEMEAAGHIIEMLGQD